MDEYIRITIVKTVVTKCSQKTTRTTKPYLFSTKISEKVN